MKLYDVIRKEEANNPKWKNLPPEEGHQKEHRRARRPWQKKRIIILGAAVLFLGVIYFLGNRLARAKVIVVERRIPIVLTGAELELAHDSESSDGRLSFQTMALQETATMEVFGSGLQNVNEKASGTVVFFNEYSKAKQTVKKGTTLTAENGKKYVTQAAVTVAGYTTDGKKKVPGTTEPVAVLAAETGESYNTKGTSFSVSGWASASKTFYARSASEIKGGEAGMSHTLTAAEREAAIETLRARLAEKLRRESRAQIPDALVTFPELQFLIVDSDSLVLHGEGVKFPASMSGQMISYLIPRELLEQTIAGKGISKRDFAKATIPDLADISIQLRTPAPASVEAVPDTVLLSVSGSLTAIAKVPVEALKESLIGLPRRAFDEALSLVPEADSAQARFMPFWAPVFPTQEKRITIITK